MGDDTVRPAPQKRGCLKWFCGCLAVAALVCVAGLAAGGWLLSRWGAGRSAWEHLPAGTVFAVETHDIATLLKTLSSDPGAASLATALFRPLQTYFGERNIPVQADLPDMVLSWGRYSSWLHPLLLPNYLLCGAGDFNGGGMFFIVRQPRWISWTIGLAAAEGVVEEVADDEGTRAFAALRDGFLILGGNRDTVARVSDNWETRAAPLGKSAGRTDAYVMLAGRADGKGDAAARDGAGDGPFLSGGLADGFASRGAPAPAAPRAAPSAAGGAAGGFRAQALVFPGEDGWRVRFGIVRAGASFDGQSGDPAGGVVLPDASDVEIALRASSSVLARLRGNRLADCALDGAEGVFSLLASRPVEEGGGAYPPLPVVSFGWDLDPARAPEAWAARFAGALGGCIDRVPFPARSLLSLETAGDGVSGGVSVPPVVVNGARPVWRFLPRSTPPTGWIATDPSGLPEDSLVGRLAARGLAEPGEGRVAAAANWDMSRAFLDAAAAVAEDRLRQMPEAWFAGVPGGKKTAAPGIRAARQFFTAYPRGAARVEIDAETLEAKGGAFLPFGTGAAF